EPPAGGGRREGVPAHQHLGAAAAAARRPPRNGLVLTSPLRGRLPEAPPLLRAEGGRPPPPPVPGRAAARPPLPGSDAGDALPQVLPVRGRRRRAAGAALTGELGPLGHAAGLVEVALLVAGEGLQEGADGEPQERDERGAAADSREVQPLPLGPRDDPQEVVGEGAEV